MYLSTASLHMFFTKACKDRMKIYLEMQTGKESTVESEHPKGVSTHTKLRMPFSHLHNWANKHKRSACIMEHEGKI